MIVIDELYNTVVFQFAPDELVRILEEIKTKKEIEIQLLKSKIHKFEMKKRMEEAYYQSLSTFKKIFAGRPPSHHQAVEYLVNVKERFVEIEVIKRKMFSLDRIISQVQMESEKEEIILSPIIIEEIRKWKETEDNKK
jgi:acetyl-CoA carboxylase alpha subunit